MLTILILCTGNSARSIIGEVLFRDLGGKRLTGLSAGSDPKDEPHPQALATLAAHGHSVDGLSSKRWDVFAKPGAPEIDAVITVCDSAAAETCPVWPGAPVSAHWGLPDPAAVADPDAARIAFETTYQTLHSRIRLLIDALDGDDREALASALDALPSLER